MKLFPLPVYKKMYTLLTFSALFLDFFNFFTFNFPFYLFPVDLLTLSPFMSFPQFTLADNSLPPPAMEVGYFPIYTALEQDKVGRTIRTLEREKNEEGKNEKLEQ
jgi:hypothetical protein